MDRGLRLRGHQSGSTEEPRAILATFDLALRAACERGTRLIDAAGSRAAFERSLLESLDQSRAPALPEPDFDSLEVALSPMVRLLDLDTGRHLNDYASGLSSSEATSHARHLLGRRCSELDSAEMERIEGAQGLFRNGILSLVPHPG